MGLWDWLFGGGKRTEDIYLPSETGQVDPRLYIPGGEQEAQMRAKAAQEMKQTQGQQVLKDALRGLGGSQ